MQAPVLRLTPTAKAALSRALEDIQARSNYRAVVTVGWRIRGASAGWGVGFYDPAQISQVSPVQIDGIDFVFLQGDISMRLDGKALDYVNGDFLIKDDAI